MSFKFVNQVCLIFKQFQNGIKMNLFANGFTFDKYIIPAGTYAAFKTNPGGLAWEEFPRLKELIFESWLPSSE